MFNQWTDFKNVEYYSVLKRKEILSRSLTRINLEDIIGETNQLQKTDTVWFHLDEIPKAVKFKEIESAMVIARGWRWGRGEMGSYLNGHRVSIL